MITFEAWPKISRLSRANTTITEKIDGTNGAVIIQPVDIESPMFIADTPSKVIQFGDDWFEVAAQSRKRIIEPGDDNYGFARWVWDNAKELADLLGVGRHFGEWWGQGIQRGYGMDRKVFSLFNYHRFSKIAQERHDWRNRANTINMSTVPLLDVGKFSDVSIKKAIDSLRENGSFASAEWGSNFPKPEGVVIYHSELKGSLKAFLENDDVPKSSVGRWQMNDIPLEVR